LTACRSISAPLAEIPVSAWYEIIGGEGTIADAILDRIVNSSHLIDFTGQSLREGILKKDNTSFFK